MSPSDLVEVKAMVMGMRDEVYRQMGQFERDKVSDPDARARVALVAQQGKIGEMDERVGRLEAGVAQLAGEVGDLANAVDTRIAALEVRVTLCEGRITRLEAKR